MNDQEKSREELAAELLALRVRVSQMESTHHDGLEEVYRTLVDDSLQGLVVYQDGRFVFVNQAIADRLGYTREELLSLTPEQVSCMPAPEDRERVNRIARDRLLGKDVPRQYEFRLLRKDGTTTWTEQYASLITYHGRPATHIVHIDIDERKRAEKSLATEVYRRRILTEQSRDGIVILDEGGGVYEVNQRFCDMLGYSRKEITRLHVWDWEYLYSRDRINEMIRTVDEKGDSFETRHKCYSARR